MTCPTGGYFDRLPSYGLSKSNRCRLLGIPRSSTYNKPAVVRPHTLQQEQSIKKRLDYWHTTMPYLGTRRLREKLIREDGFQIGRKLIRRYMKEMGIYAVYPKPNLSKPAKHPHIMPYLMRNKPIFMPNQAWAIDITFIPMWQGHMFLTAIIDWYSRFIVGWVLSDTLETESVLQAVKVAIRRYGVPSIINSDQGSQFTSADYRALLKQHGIRQSMDGKARWVDNVIIERWFRSLKVEYVYINEYSSPNELRAGVSRYIEEYNDLRPHQSLEYQTPSETYRQSFTPHAAG
jgi:putative transposase